MNLMSMKREILVCYKIKKSFLILGLIFLAGCSGQLKDPSTLNQASKPGDFFESWDPDQVTAPGANLITFTAGDTETTFPYYTQSKMYPIKFKVNSGGLPPGIIDPGIYSVKLEYSANNGSTWIQITGAANIPVSAGIINIFNWLIPNSVIDGNLYLIKLTARSVSGDATTAVSSQNFIIDSSGPNLTSFSLTLGSLGVSNATTINRSFFSFSLNANDSLTPIKYYCLKTDGSSVPPVESDDCWQSFSTPSTIITAVNQSGFIGFVGGTYSLRIWAQNQASIISTLTAGTGTLGLDRIDVTYNPAVAPDISNVIISNNNSVSLNPAPSELVFSAGQNIYVRWKATDTDLATNPISVFTTTDEKIFTAVTGLQNITNTNQGGCTLDLNYTGCAVFAAPTSGYFRVQIGAIDQTGLVSKGGSVGANMGKFNLIVGNTDVGLNGSANKAIFINKTQNQNVVPQSGILAVTKKGKVFYLDNVRGILVIDPQDGTQKIFIQRSGSNISSGDTGLYSSATTANTVKISVDYEDRLLILEKDRIRRVETNGTINTIIGGGSTAYNNITKAAISALSYNMNLAISSANANETNKYLFQPLPNGNIWFGLNHDGIFNNDNGNLFGIYKASDNKVYFLGLKGNGSYGDPTFNLMASQTRMRTAPAITFDRRTSFVKYISTYFCVEAPGGCSSMPAVNFNPASGQNVAYGTQYPRGSDYGTDAYIASRKGELYSISRLYPPGLFKFNDSNLTWTKKLGPTGTSYGVAGTCADGMNATDCDIDLADAFITENNTIYFVDRDGIVRVIANGIVQTLFGQSLAYGDGGPPTSARLGTVNWLGIWGTENNVVTYDQQEFNIREFNTLPPSPVQPSSAKLCGNGKAGSPLFTSGIYSDTTAENEACYGVNYYVPSPSGMGVDRRNGEVYTSLGGRVVKLLRSGSVPSPGLNLNKWKTLVGSGSTYDFLSTGSDNQLGTNIFTGGWPIAIFGLMQPASTCTSPSFNAGCVENGNAESYVLMNAYNTTSGVNSKGYYKAANGNNGMVRAISGSNGNTYGTLLTNIGQDFSTTNIKPLFENYPEAVYVQENKSIIFGAAGFSVLTHVPISRDGADLITGAGLISNNYFLGKNITSFNYRWNLGALSDIFYCATDGTLNRYTIGASPANKVCVFPKTSVSVAFPTGENMFTCYGKSIHWDATKTKLIFPVKQNGVSAVAQYDVTGCN